MRNGFASPLLIVGIIAGLLGVGFGVQTKRLENAKAEYAAFKSAAKALADQAESEKIRKEKENADRIQTAITERDNALKRLRNYAANSRKLPDNTAAASSSGRVSIETTVYDRAMAEFRKELERSMGTARQFAQSGDEANIDAKALVDSWPK